MIRYNQLFHVVAMDILFLASNLHNDLVFSVTMATTGAMPRGAEFGRLDEAP